MAIWRKGRAKYGNRKTVVDGVTFDSAKEARVWTERLLLVCTGAISDLKRQVRFPLVVNGITVCVYVADFTYLELGVLVVEDVKGFKTPIYNLKKKLMKAVHGIDIRET